jgi:low affinity Fe/Cu permease
MSGAFNRFARLCADLMGHAWAFILSTALCIVWAASGPFFDYSDTWQLVINTATTVLTFLAVFLIQNTQNRDGLAIQLKLDELIRAVASARNRLVHLEDLTDDELEQLRRQFQDLRRRERRSPVGPGEDDPSAGR